MMENRYFKVKTSSRYIVGITVGPTRLPGYEAVEQTVDRRQIGIGWSYIDGQFIDTTDTYAASQTHT